jgi:hypothetical protein
MAQEPGIYPKYGEAGPKGKKFEIITLKLVTSSEMV